MQVDEGTRGTLSTVGQACNLLEGSGAHSFVNLGHKPFDEIEAKFRETWYKGDPNNIFDPNPQTDFLDLIGIIKFE